MSLSQPNQNLLNQASSSAIEATFEEINTNWSNSQWLRPRNRYLRNCIDKIETDTKPPRRITHRHLREYIAASSLAHCMDSWSYLGRGIDAHLRGAPDIARHLGYYAELRAAMSLLASEGVGVFDKTHFVVNGKKKCEQIKASRTHEFAWDALEHWATTPSAASLIFKVIQPGGIPLEKWLNSFLITPGLHAILAERWLLQWGLDLKQLRDDRNARNSASYRPNVFSNSHVMNIGDALQFVKDFWLVCEPTESIRFPALDRYLLRQSLELTFRSVQPHNRSRKQAKRMFERQVDVMLHGLAPGDLTTEKWSEFLRYSESPELPLVMKEAKAKDEPPNPRHHLQVLARATLLLRVATGACHTRLKTLPNFIQTLEFWWTKLGENKCLWHIGEQPDRIIDLWTDIREAVQTLDGWQSAPNVSGISYNKLWLEQSAAAGVLGSCERVGLWGVGL